MWIYVVGLPLSFPIFTLATCSLLHNSSVFVICYVPDFSFVGYLSLILKGHPSNKKKSIQMEKS